MRPAKERRLVFLVAIILLPCNIYFIALHNIFGGLNRGDFLPRQVLVGSGNFLRFGALRRALWSLHLAGLWGFHVPDEGLGLGLDGRLETLPEHLRHHAADVIRGGVQRTE